MRSEHLGEEVRVAAHRLTAEPLVESILVDRFIEDDEVIGLKGSPQVALRAMHTPGHARGHLCFHEERTGTLISGDNVVGLGSVLIDPPEGNMREYLRSLERMRALPNLSVWRSLEDLRRFVYEGLHAGALNRSWYLPPRGFLARALP